MAVIATMLPWCLNLNLSLMSPIKPSFFQNHTYGLYTSFEEFQYGPHDDYFANKNASVSANLYLHVGLVSRMITVQFKRCL